MYRNLFVVTPRKAQSSFITYLVIQFNDLTAVDIYADFLFIFLALSFCVDAVKGGICHVSILNLGTPRP